MNPDGSHPPTGGFDAAAGLAGLLTYLGGDWDLPEDELAGGRAGG